MGNCLKRSFSYHQVLEFHTLSSAVLCACPIHIKNLLSSLIQACQRIQHEFAPSHRNSALPFALHPGKCKRLATSYLALVKDVLMSTEQACVCLSFLPSLQDTLSEKLHAPLTALLHALYEGQSFLQDCCSLGQSCLVHEKAFALLSSTDAVDTHLHDLAWCTSVLSEAFHELHSLHHDYVSREVTQAQRICEVLNDIWSSSSDDDFMGKAGTFDVRKLLGKKGKGKVSRFAEFMYHRLSTMGAYASVGDSPAVDDELPGDMGHDALPGYMWLDADGFSRTGECLGMGSHGEIHEVMWMGGRFASKDFFYVEDISMFRREAAVQARLQHPNVVHLVCCTRSSSVHNKCSLVMELMPQDLRSLIIDRVTAQGDPPFPLLAAVDLMLQIAKGMEYLHGLHIIHRDLKSSNILVSHPYPASYLDERGHVKVKIADFGMAKAKDMSSMYSTLDTGTTRWMAPEVFDMYQAGQSSSSNVPRVRYTKKADVYSFAMVSFEILTGKLPFDNNKNTEVRKKIMEGERPELPASSPPALASYIQQCWHQDPSKRPGFKQICGALRYLKACILLGEQKTLRNSWPTCVTDVVGDQLETSMIRDNKANTAHSSILKIPLEMYQYFLHQNMRDGEDQTSPTPPAPDQQRGAGVIEGFSEHAAVVHSIKQETPQTNAPFEALASTQRLVQQTVTSVHEHIVVATAQAGGGAANARLDNDLSSSNFQSWRKLDLLETGSFATVYKGMSKDGFYFAVKEVSLSEQDNKAQQCVLQLEQEIAFLSKYHHENIVRYLGTQKENNKFYIFHELVTEGSLASLYRKCPLFDTQIRLYTRQILSGLKYLHDQGVLHRDIKCANILVDVNGRIKLAYFGLAKQVSESEELKECKGSDHWMAPEVVDPRKTCSFPADIWSLGCTVLEMATRCNPFGEMEWHRVLWKVGHGEAPMIPETLSEEARDFISRCLEVNPSRRPTAAQLLEHPYCVGQTGLKAIIEESSSK